MMNAECGTGVGDLAVRTKHFALRAMQLAQKLPNTVSGRCIVNQFIRCSTAVGANYRAARRARSPAEFVAKIGIVIEEADEAMFWLEIMTEGSLIQSTYTQPLLDEANEILSIMVASSKTARSRLVR